MKKKVIVLCLCHKDANAVRKKYIDKENTLKVHNDWIETHDTEYRFYSINAVTGLQGLRCDECIMSDYLKLGASYEQRCLAMNITKRIIRKSC